MPESNPNALRILIADSSRTMRQLIRREFDPRRFEVFEAASGSDALRLALDVQPAVVTLGLVLSDKSGIETCAQISELCQEQETAVIIVTADDTDDERRKAFQAGAVHFVRKDFKQGEIASYVEEILRPRRILEGKKVLVVDDSPLPRASLRRLLEARGASVVEADDGSTALALLDGTQFDLILTDHFMSEMNGLPFVHEVRQRPALALTPVILLSASRGHGILASALRAGANDFVRKPYESTELLARIRSALKLSGMSQQLHAALEQARSANQAKSAFLANMSHEIRTPLTALLGFTQLLIEGEAEATASSIDRLEGLRIISRNGEHLLDLINDILDCSKIEAGRMEVHLQVCHLRDILHGVQLLFQNRAKEKGLVLEVNCPDSVRRVVRTDPLRLKQILINLVGNAVKFTEQGSVRLEVSEEAQSPDGSILCFDVFDTGIGLSPKDALELFKPFTQAGTVAHQQPGGTGLGLTLSRQLARLMGGEVTLFSTNPGKGSQFRATIQSPALSSQLEDANAEAVTESVLTATAARGGPLHARLLVAEDGADNRKLLEHILVRAGANVTFVVDGAQAVEAALTSIKAGQKPFDVILMDMQMPVLDGYATTRQLRDKGYRGIIIALTANAMQEDRRRCLDAGCDHFLTKPINKALLLATIHHSIQGANRTSETHKPRTEPVMS